MLVVRHRCEEPDVSCLYYLANGRCHRSSVQCRWLIRDLWECRLLFVCSRAVLLFAIASANLLVTHSCVAHGTASDGR